MIENKTVLILGAGASKPYGFPLGTELRQQILTGLSDASRHQFTLLQSCGFTPSQIKDFHDDLHDALHDTIDDFLSDRPTHRVIGACAITIALMTCEDHKRVFPKHDWYPQLFQLLDFKHDNPLLTGVVTLNYDRSLEHYLYQTISVSYEGQTRSKAEARLRSFPICHIHGKLGEYPSRPYRSTAQPEEILKVADALRITTDPDLDNSPLYESARRMCYETDTIVFLGFGYHARVLKRLALGTMPALPKILGTQFPASPKRRKEIQDQFQNRIALDDHGYDIAAYFLKILLQ